LKHISDTDCSFLTAQDQIVKETSGSIICYDVKKVHYRFQKILYISVYYVR